MILCALCAVLPVLSVLEHRSILPSRNTYVWEHRGVRYKTVYLLLYRIEFV